MLLLTAYAAAGFLFGIAFVIAGVGRLDQNARGTSVGFRILILPGLLVFWPLFALRWLAGTTAPPEERSAHLLHCKRSPAEESK